MKRFLIAFFILASATGIYAFSQPADKPDSRRLETTYVFTGSAMDDQRDPLLYEKDNDALPCQSGSTVICQIITETDEGDHPDFSTRNPVVDTDEFVEVSKRD